MNVIEVAFKDVYLIKSEKFEDFRGFFIESFNYEKIKKIIGSVNFVQDNHSKSCKGVLRGLHYQIKNPQGKLVRCISGTVNDVIVDIRKTSPTFGKWKSFKLNSSDISLWVPPGFAHGFYTLSNFAEVTYKTTDYYYPEYDRTLIWNDPDLNIDWELSVNPILSPKDMLGKSMVSCEKYE